MQRIAALFFLALSLLGANAAHAFEAHPLEGQVVRIEVRDADWEGASPADIKLLLEAVATEMLTHFPGRRLDPIIVSRSHEGPVVLFVKGPQNASQVRLAASGERWAEYIYEFSHELFHILANYQYRAAARNSQYQWFEEMLCETASLAMLKRFAARWEEAPPHPRWASYGGTLNRFTQRALNEPHRQLPPGVSFTQWFRENGPALRTNPYLRGKNELVASYFLPLLERNADWRAFAYLNQPAVQQPVGFNDYLLSWQHRTPAPQRTMVANAMRIFNPDPVGVRTRLLAAAERFAPAPLAAAPQVPGPAGPSAPRVKEDDPAN
mgnify:FL=1